MSSYPVAVDITSTLIKELEHFKEKFRPASNLTRYDLLRSELSLPREPFIGYLSVSEKEKTERFLICRNYVPVEFHACDHPAVEFASYLSPVGSLVSKAVGHQEKISIQHHRGWVLSERHLTVMANATFVPEMGPVPDAADFRLSWDSSSVSGNSLRDINRKLLSIVESEPDSASETGESLVPHEYTLQSRRIVAQVTQLPDRAILDDIQDPVFRHPLDSLVLITGAPGTGKTTVQVKRLAQKTKWEFLTTAERDGIAPGSWSENGNWLFFTPSNLLKSYLKEALSKEWLPAGDATVKVWEDYRIELMRAAGLLRVDKNGRSPLSRGSKSLLVVKDFSSPAITLLAKEFFRWLKSSLENEVREHLELPANFPSPLSVIASKRAETKEELESYKNRRLIDLKPERREEIEAEIQRLQRVNERINPSERNKSSPLGYAELFHRIPHLYNRFRQTEPFLFRFYGDSDAALDALKEGALDSHEIGILLYAALRWVRENDHRLVSGKPSALPDGAPGALLRDQKLLVAIDEATDFAAIDLATMALLADPLKNSVTLSGDIMQRLTTTGIRSWDELALLNQPVKRFELRRAYRQTPRLSGLAASLYSEFSGDSNPPADPVHYAGENPHILLRQCGDLETLADWLTERILEIYRINGEKLPSLGILLPSESEVVPLSKLLESRLYAHALDVEASLGGQSLGEAAKIRVFCVEHIKGLEFEAVFFCHIDGMAQSHPELVDKFLYVGVSRARNFLGLTYRDSFPARLESVRSHLSESEGFIDDETLLPWPAYLDEQQPDQLPPEDRALLDSHFNFYFKLFRGVRKPESEKQTRFVEFSRRVFRGESSEPVSEHERAFGRFLMIYRDLVK